jgi:hypothetical protein
MKKIKKSIFYITIFILIFSISSCKRGNTKKVMIEHEYSIKAKDVSGTFLKNVHIDYKVSQLLSSEKRKEGNATIDGNQEVLLTIIPLSGSGFNSSAYTSVSGIASLSGYYDTFFSESILDLDFQPRPRKYIEIVLIKPSDYLEKELWQDKNYDSYLTFVDKLKIEGKNSKAKYELKQFPAISTSVYKNNKYLSIGLIGSQEFNSLKLSQYEIGANLFDDAIRGIFREIRSCCLNNNLYGYNVNFSTSQKDFSNKYTVPHDLTYNFFFPKKYLLKYIEQEISGQSLLDESIVLINEDRVNIQLK